MFDPAPCARGRRTSTPVATAAPPHRDFHVQHAVLGIDQRSQLREDEVAHRLQRFWPCNVRVKRARLVLSQSCSVLLLVVTRRLLIISLIVSESWRISPWASTLMERDRSPLVTAVETSAIARTWAVKLAAMELT